MRGSTERYVNPNTTAKNVEFNRLNPLRVNTDSVPSNILTRAGAAKQKVAQFSQTATPKRINTASNRQFWPGHKRACFMQRGTNDPKVSPSRSCSTVTHWKNA